MTRRKPRKHAGRARAEGPLRLPDPGTGPSVVSLSEASRYLGIHSSTLRRWIGSGKVNTAEGNTSSVEMTEIARVRGLMNAESQRPPSERAEGK